jgi:DNA-directed RNA polymerase alpha subunit
MPEKAKISDTAALTAKKQTRDLALPVTALGLSTRATNALLNDYVRSVAQLVPRTEADLLGIPNFGRGALAELKKALARRKLRLDMVARRNFVPR